MSSIRLHPKHGVNPTISQCFWCGAEKNELALLGAAYRGEAPRHMVLDYEPCDACQANFDKGIALLEATQAHGEAAKPTGRYVVATEDAVRRWFQPQETVEQILEARKAFIERDVFEQMFAGEHNAPSS